MLLAAAMTAAFDGAWAQEFPNKPVRIVTSGVGGGNDFAARLIATGITPALGQQVIVENRPGASGIIAAQAVSAAPPDGHTLLLYTGSIWTLPLLRNNVPFDPVADFSPITLAVSSPNILVLHPALPIKSVRELIALAKYRPGELNSAGGESGSTTHLAAVLFDAMASVEIVRIPYKSGATRIADLIGGHVQMMFATAGSVSPHVRSGKLKALAVTSAKPSRLVPGVPTVAASGLPGYEAISVIALFAPARTPPAIIDRLNQVCVALLNTRKAQEQFAMGWVETVASSPAQAAAYIKADMAKWGRLIKDAGIREE